MRTQSIFKPVMGKRLNQSGFTLLELMVSLAIGSIIMTGVFGAFINQHKAYLVQEDIGEMQQAARAVMGMLQHDMTMARYGAPSDSLTDWLLGVATDPNLTSNPRIVDGAGGAPDIFSYLWVDPTETVTLAAPVAIGDQTFTVQAGAGALFANAPVPLFFIGEFLNGNVAKVTGDTIDINLANLAGGGGGGGGGGPGKGNKKNGGAKLTQAIQDNAFQWDFPVGTRVGVVRQVTYEVVKGTASGSDACPSTTVCLVRHNGRGPRALWSADLVAYDVEDFQVAPDGNNAYLVSLTVRAPRKDPDYTAQADGYRRFTITSERITIRNPGTFVFN